MLKRSCIIDVLEIKERCKFYLFGAKCEDNCGLCSSRENMRIVTDAYIRRQNLTMNNKKKMFNSFLEILTDKKVNGKVLGGLENIDQVFLYIALDQLRMAIAWHIRGTKLSSAPKLELLLTLYKECVHDLKNNDAYKFLNVRQRQISVYNDNKTELDEVDRQHLIHGEITFTAGFHIGHINWARRGWSNDNSLDILAKAESIKRKVRHTVFNTEYQLEFTPPEFDNENRTFTDSYLTNIDVNNTNKPLAPTKDSNRTFIL